MIVEKLLHAVPVFEGFGSAFLSGREGSRDVGVFKTFGRACALQKTMDEAGIEAIARTDRIH